MARPIGIVFDLDDTLYLERDYALSGFKAVAERLGDRRFVDAAWHVFCRGDRSRVFDLALPAIGIDLTPALISELVRCYRGHLPTIALAPDAVRFLARWPADRPLGLLTDGFHHSQRNKVAALGLERSRFQPIVFTDAWGRDYWKPHVRGFEAIAAAWDLPPTALVYVADNPAKDFVAPNELGWRTVQVARPDGVHRGNLPVSGGEPQATVRSLDELEAALAPMALELPASHCHSRR